MVTTGIIQRTEEERKRRPINRLQTIYALRASQDENYEAMKEAAKEAGKPVVWSTGDTGWGHILYKTMGISDTYWDGYSSVIAAAGRAPFFCDRCDAEGFPSHICGYYRVMLGYAARMAELGGQIPPEAPPRQPVPKPTFLVMCLHCDTHQKAIQAAGRFLDAPVYHQENRFRQNQWSRLELDERYFEDGVIKFGVKELKEFAAWLERLLGKKFDWDKFEEEIEGNMQVQGLWDWSSREGRKVRPNPVNFRDQLTATAGRLFGIADIPKYRALFKNVEDEVRYRIDNKISGINRPEKYRVGMGSIPPWHGLEIFDQLAERGWNFVSGGYGSVRPIDLSWVKDPAEKAIRYYRRSLAQEIDEDFPPEEAPRIKEQIKQQGYSYELVARDARIYQTDGYFIHPLRTCHKNASTSLLMQHALMEAYKVPSISIDGDHIDPRLFDPVDAMKKFEAFEETMDHYKEVRKKEGLEW